MPTRIVLDTDIGDDIDDALALAVAVASPELRVEAVTTVLGNVSARSQLARTILRAAGPPHSLVPVSAGCGATLSSRPFGHAEQYLQGALPNQHVVSGSEDSLPPELEQHGVDVLVELLRTGEVVPVTIGPLTNLAVALTKDRLIAERIPRVVAMAAEFKAPMAEYNVACDPEALAIVLRSGVRIDFTPFQIGIDTQLTDAEVERIAATDRPVARLLYRAIEAWRTSHDRSWNPNLFDPMALLGIEDDSLFEWRTGHVRVELRGTTTFGYTTFRPDPDGPHRVAWTADRDRCVGLFLDRILSL